MLLFCSEEDAKFPDMAALQEMSGRDERNVRKGRKEMSLKILSEEDRCSVRERTQGQESTPEPLVPSW